MNHVPVLLLRNLILASWRALQTRIQHLLRQRIAILLFFDQGSPRTCRSSKSMQHTAVLPIFIQLFIAPSSNISAKYIFWLTCTLSHTHEFKQSRLLHSFQVISIIFKHFDKTIELLLQSLRYHSFLHAICSFPFFEHVFLCDLPPFIKVNSIASYSLLCIVMLCIVVWSTTLHQGQFHSFLFFCYVLSCYVLLCDLPPFIKVNSIASYSFVMYCHVMYCCVIYHPSSRSIP